VTVRELRRLFWRGAAALLVVAALVALSALLGGDFNETDGEILITLAGVLLAGGVALVGLGLRERRRAEPLGWVIALLAPVGFVLIVVYVWQGFEGDKAARWAGTSVVVLCAAAVIGSSVLLLRHRDLHWLVIAEGMALGVAVVATFTLIWVHDAGDGTARLCAAGWILAVLGWLLVPVLQRSRSVEAPAPVVSDERVIATLADVDLVVTSHPQPGDLVVRGVSELTPGERIALRLRKA
jgi:hypothetical protein